LGKQYRQNKCEGKPSRLPDLEQNMELDRKNKRENSHGRGGKNGFRLAKATASRITFPGNGNPARPTAQWRAKGDSQGQQNRKQKDAA
jgi:hypothetical protein